MSPFLPSVPFLGQHYKNNIMLSMSPHVASIWNIAEFGLLILMFVLLVDATVKSSNTFCWRQCWRRSQVHFFCASAFSSNMEIGCVAGPVFDPTLWDQKNGHLVDKSVSIWFNILIYLILPIAFFTNLSSTDTPSLLMKVLVIHVICLSAACLSLLSILHAVGLVLQCPHLQFLKVSAVLLGKRILTTRLQPYWQSSS